jgi:DNA-binding transcriptional ArsR family regulator
VETVTVDVTPRFEIFYALQALESGAGERLSGWRREMERRIPARARTEIARVAPCPLMWPLLADALREQPPSISFAQIISALTTMDDAAFQRAVLGGAFKTEGAVDGLMSGRTSLKRTVTAELKTQEKLLSLLGLHPFDAHNASAYAFERIVSQPSAYRSEAVSALEMFWQVGFGDTWSLLETQMTMLARAMRTAITRKGFAAFASEKQLPASVSARETLAVHVIPSALNVAKLWAAYKDSHERTTFYVPILDTSLSPVSEKGPQRTATQKAVRDPALVFKALGDTTRYAIATTLARSPMTSVELSKLFKVSKPTISHHVAHLRAADLLVERQTENGIVLSLNRRVLERASDLAAGDMYSADGPDHVVKRSRRSKR